MQKIGAITLVVEDYDQRNGAEETCLLLARADSDDQQSHIGNQAGGRVFLFLHTDDFWRDYRDMISRGV